MNIIGDIAGRFDELMALLKKMPKEPIVLVGDLVDRGPKSKQVIEWAMANQDNVTVIYGNHEDMMVDACSGGNAHLWVYNGGGATLLSYGAKEGDIQEALALVPKEHIEWLKKRPKFLKKDGLIVSHAPIRFKLEDIEKLCHYQEFFWNRNPPKKIDGLFQIHGHNSVHEKYDDYGMCIDNSAMKELMGVHWPSKKIYKVKYKKIKT